MSECQFKVTYSPPGTDDITTMNTTPVGASGQHVEKDGPNGGYPDQMGKMNLTSNLSGYRESFEPGSYVLAYSIYHYTDRPLTRETWLTGTPPTSVSGIGLDYPASFASAENVLNSKLYAKIRSEMTRFQGGVFLGEFQQTIKLIRSPSKRIEAATLALASRFQFMLNMMKRRKIPMTRRNVLANWSNVWLEYVYGVMPLISDVKSLADQIEAINHRDHQVKVTVGGSDSTSETAHAPQFAFAWNWNETVETNYRWDGKASALIRVTPYVSGHSMENYGLGLKDVVPTLYELVPFSFLIDYFSNVNSVLNSYFVEEGAIVYKWAALGMTQDRSSVCTDPVHTMPYTTATFTANGTRYRRKDVRRWDPVSDENIFAYRLKFPSAKQVINIGALISALSSIKYP